MNHSTFGRNGQRGHGADNKIYLFTLRTVGPQALYCASRSYVSTRRNSLFF